MTLPIVLMLVAAMALVLHGRFVRTATLPEPVFFGGDGFGCAADGIA